MNGQRRHSWMWAEACALLDQAERRHRHFFDLLSAPSAVPAWEPPTDIFSSGREWYVRIALPGASADEISVQITASKLFIEATVAPVMPAADMEVVRLEIPYGRMRRRIDLPSEHYRLVDHRLEHGCLVLRLTRSTP